MNKHATNLLNAFQTALGVLGLPAHANPKVQNVVTECGIIPALVAFRWSKYSVSLMHEVRPTFGLSTHLSIDVATGSRPRCEFKVTWPSGGGEVSMALAEASQHLGWIQKVAQAEAIIKYALSSTPKDELEGALKDIEREADETSEAIREALGL